MAKIEKRKHFSVYVTRDNPRLAGANWNLYASTYPSKAEANAAVRRAITGGPDGYLGARIIEEYRLPEVR